MEKYNKIGNKFQKVVIIVVFVLLSIGIFAAVQFFIFRIGGKLVDSNVCVNINTDMFSIISGVFLILGFLIGWFCASSMKSWSLREMAGNLENPIIAREAIFWIQQKIELSGWPKIKHKKTSIPPPPPPQFPKGKG